MSQGSRRSSRAIVIVTGLALALLGAGAGTATGVEMSPAARAPGKLVSHFLCYVGTFRPVFDDDPVVSLVDRFGSSVVTVKHSNIFCNPTAKRHAGKVTPIVDEDHHLKHYGLQAPQTGETLDVLVTNQFGADQPIQLNRTPLALLVPTRKLPHPRPRGLSHYTCYNVHQSQVLDKGVRLRDEFGRYRTRISQQWLLCNPTSKTHGSAPPTNVRYPQVSLACYLTGHEPSGNEPKRKTINQFEGRSVHATVDPGYTLHLCVPSTIEVVV
jgi:hypothetical protein